MALKIITDPVTNQSFSRDLNDPNSRFTSFTAPQSVGEKPKQKGDVPVIDGSSVGKTGGNVPTAKDTSKTDEAMAKISTSDTATQNSDAPDFNSFVESITSAAPEGDRELISQLLNQANSTSGGAFTKAYEDLTSKFLQSTSRRRDRQADERRLQDKFNLPELESELFGIQSNQETLEAARNSRLVNEVGKVRGMTEAQAASRTNAIQRQYGLQVADNRINELVTAGKINAATRLIDAKLDLKYGDIESEIELYKSQLDFITPGLNKENQKLAQQQQFALQQASNIITDARTKEKELDLTKAEAMKNAVERGASPMQIAQIQDAKSIQEVAQTGFTTSLAERLQTQKLGLDIQKARVEIGALNQQFDFTNLGADTAVEQQILASAKYGDKNLTDSQLQKIQQATNALGSLESLQGLLAQGEDGVSLTGPVTGRVRKLVTALGGDADAKAINATLQGLIPTVARGIFGEVGVLTNADIENYKQTLPNLTSTEDQNKLVSLMMYDVLSRSLQNTLVTNAQNQVNVSNFLGTYQNVQQRIINAKAELGITSLTGLDSNALLDSIPQTQSQQETQTDFLTEFNNFIYGQQ